MLKMCVRGADESERFHGGPGANASSSEGLAELALSYLRDKKEKGRVDHVTNLCALCVLMAENQISLTN